MTKQQTQDNSQSFPSLRPSRGGLAPALARRIFVVACGVLVAWDAFLFYAMAQRNMTDFGKFYYSTVAFLQGLDMYGPSAAILAGGGAELFKNMNPPHFHLLLLPLALLPPGLALALWGVASLLSLLASLRLFVREVSLKLTPWQWRLGTLGLLSFVGTAGVLITGQLTFLLLLPVTLAWVEARRGRWTHAGGYLGLTISVKPFLLIFMPYLVCRRQFRAVAAASVTASLCFVAGLFVCGVEAHRAWLRAIASVDWMWASLNASVFGLLSRALGPSGYYSPLVTAPNFIKPLGLVAAGVIGTLTLVAAISNSTTETEARDRDRGGELITHHPSLITRKIAVDRGFALLLLGSLLISPLGWAYYLWLPLGPLVALATMWWSDPESGKSVTQSRGVRWRGGLLLAGITGLMWPFTATDLFQPHTWATVSVGSMYFWGTFALWASLIVDWRVAENTGLTTVEQR